MMRYEKYLQRLGKIKGHDLCKLFSVRKLKGYGIGFLEERSVNMLGQKQVKETAVVVYTYNNLWVVINDPESNPTIEYLKDGKWMVY